MSAFFQASLFVSTLLNITLFLGGILLGIYRSDLLLFASILALIGAVGTVAMAVICLVKPRSLALCAKRWRHPREDVEMDCLPKAVEPPPDPDDVLRNIRGIPYLIQAIHYSMETTLYRDMLSDIGEGVVRTSVIHTAPACRSVLDSEEELDKRGKEEKTPRDSTDRSGWSAAGAGWRNEQLRLSVENRADSDINVFPYCESSPQRGSFELRDHIWRRGGSMRGERASTASPLPSYQLRCIGMSASFIQRFNSSFKDTTSG